MRILVAEDDPVSRRLLQSTLMKWEHEPVVVENGRDALAVLGGPCAPEMAILDWMMPEMDGPEVCRRIRQHDPHVPVYIILLTAKSHREDLVGGFDSGADDYVTKPFNHRELLARLQAGIRVIQLQRSLVERARELELAIEKLQLIQHSQKMEALGKMTAGIAHEINTPVQYLSDNIEFFRESWAQIDPILKSYPDSPELDYLIREVPRAIEDSAQGTMTIGRIIRAMREFSRPSGKEKTAIDINQAIQTTLEISRNEWGNVAEAETEFDLSLPRTRCLPAELHQVVLALIVNATQAMADNNAGRYNKGLLTITTAAGQGYVEIRVSDTGIGIPVEHRERVFEPFFTTRDAGKGSGQGLSSAYSVVVQQHNGRIWFESEVGRGTTFIIQLPMDSSDAKDKAEAQPVLLTQTR